MCIRDRFRGGIGSVMPIGEARESYREALKALRESGSHIAHIADIPAVREYDGEYPLDLENEYYKRGLAADAAGTTACANELFDWMAERYPDYRADIEIKVLELVMQLEYRAFFNGGVKYGFRYRENYIREIQTADSLEELRRWFVGKTRDICEHLVSGKKREMCIRDRHQVEGPHRRNHHLQHAAVFLLDHGLHDHRTVDQ